MFFSLRHGYPQQFTRTKINTDEEANLIVWIASKGMLEKLLKKWNIAGRHTGHSYGTSAVDKVINEEAKLGIVPNNKDFITLNMQRRRATQLNSQFINSKVASANTGQLQNASI